MPYGAGRSGLEFLPDALLASQVGTWETDFGTDLTKTNAVTAEIFGLDPLQAAVGLPLEAFTKSIHPADREGFDTNIARVCEHGGLLVVEYRVRSRYKGERWVLARGHYHRDATTGITTGTGIVVDITDCRKGMAHSEGAIFLLKNTAGDPLDEIASQVIQIRRTVDDFHIYDKQPLRVAVDSLLWAVGRAIAQRQQRNDSSTFG